VQHPSRQASEPRRPAAAAQRTRPQAGVFESGLSGLQQRHSAQRLLRAERKRIEILVVGLVDIDGAIIDGQRLRDPRGPGSRIPDYEDGA
jgi:hypothetical protein